MRFDGIEKESKKKKKENPLQGRISSINIKYTSISILWIRSSLDMDYTAREGEINKNQNRTPTIWDLLPSLLLLVYSSDITAKMIFFSLHPLTLLDIRIHMPVTPPQKKYVYIYLKEIWFGFESLNENSLRDHCHHEFMAGWLVAVLNGNVTILYESLP